MEQLKKKTVYITINDDDSVDSNYDPEIPTLATSKSVDGLTDIPSPSGGETIKYDAAMIRAEFKAYQSILPHPDKLLQEQHSFTFLRNKIEECGIEVPRFLRYNFEGGIKPHQALCCLLLSEYNAQKKQRKQSAMGGIVRLLSFGLWTVQLNNPAEFIRAQFDRIATAVPIESVKPDVLRKKIKNRGLPVPNYFLDPEDDKQFPPHIALLVILQDGEKESQKLNSVLHRLAFSLFAFVALLLRIVLEVIGGAGAIWGGAEVFGLRNASNAELWRWISVAIGVLCFLRFITLNAPQREDEGDILGPAGPWSLRLPVRLRAVCEHPFHYFVRAMPPSSAPQKRE
mmetsp:Transcript_12477/g.26561  ORF Transcript_12477/g.26561 Transcript_12477/m.26561 type:complete len:342 (-) Transcript_12477:374-1399(-)